MNYHRPASRALMRMGGSVNFEPNSLDGPVQCAAFDEPPLQCQKVRRQTPDDIVDHAVINMVLPPRMSGRGEKFAIKSAD